MTIQLDHGAVSKFKPVTSPWPKGIRAVCLLTYDVDVDESFMARKFMEPILLSIGQIEPTVAVPGILQMLKDYEIKSTFFVPGSVAKRFAGMVESILKDGHEIGHHGYHHEAGTIFTSRQQELETFVRGVEALEKITGKRPVGYRSPMWEFSSNTTSVLEELKFKYTSDRMDDVLPKYHVIGEKKSNLLDLPVHWVLDDLAHFNYHTHMKVRIRSCEEVLQIYKEEFAGIYAYGGLFTLTMHPQASGRPSRLLMMREFIEYVKSFPDVWIASPGEVVDYWNKNHQTA